MGIEDTLRALVRAELAADRAARRDDLRAVMREVLDERDADQVGGVSALAKWTGKTRAAVEKAVGGAKPRDAALAALAFRAAGKHRQFRKSEVFALLATRRLRAVEGDR